MPGPALEYGPDHYTPEVAKVYVQYTLIGNYLNYAIATLLVYELFTSLDDEIARVWSLKWRLPKILFMLNRYVIRALLVALWILADFPGTSAEFCRIYSYWQMIPLRLAILAAQALVVIRVWAIYNNSRSMLYILSTLYAIEFLAVAGSILVATIDTQGVAQPAPLSCGLNSMSGYLLKRYASATWIAPVVFEFVMVLITLFKLLPRWSFRTRPNSQHIGSGSGLAFLGVPLGSGGNHTLDILARDSLVYFLFIFSFSLTNAIIYELSFGAYYHSVLLGPTSAISCIAVSRMMINIRSIPSPSSKLTGDDAESHPMSLSHTYLQGNSQTDGQYPYYGQHPYNGKHPYNASAPDLHLDLAFAETYGGGGLGLGNLPPEPEPEPDVDADADEVPGSAMPFLSTDDLNRPRRSTDLAYPPRSRSRSHRKPAPKDKDGGYYANLPGTASSTGGTSTLVGSSSPPGSSAGFLVGSSSPPGSSAGFVFSSSPDPLHTSTSSSAATSFPFPNTHPLSSTTIPPEPVYESGYEAGLRMAKQRKEQRERMKRPGTGESGVSFASGSGGG
ncbi:hypothetical protein C8F01DRAFT_1147924 [Mycena amicta]|nr:hypothetical protein C8F01DRAFT_1147924 [Mycena amicta]